MGRVGAVVDTEEQENLVGEPHSKSLTGETHPHAVRRFIVFVVVLFLVLGLVIAISPSVNENVPETDNKNVVLNSTKSPVIPNKHSENTVPEETGEIPEENPLDTDVEPNNELDEDNVKIIEQLTEDANIDPDEEVELDPHPDQDTDSPEKAESENNDEPSTLEVEHLKDFLKGENAGGDTEIDTESEELISGGKAPRTTTVPYNFYDPKEKYILYNPSGGMSNQEIELVNALRMAKALGRTLYFPMVGRHSIVTSGYNALTMAELFPADRIYDFELLGTYVPMVPLNITLKRFLGRFARHGGAHSIRYVSTGFKYDGNVEAVHLKRVNAPLIFFDGQMMWGRWWPTNERYVICYIQISWKRAMQLTVLTGDSPDDMSRIVPICDNFP